MGKGGKRGRSENPTSPASAEDSSSAFADAITDLKAELTAEFTRILEQLIARLDAKDQKILDLEQRISSLESENANLRRRLVASENSINRFKLRFFADLDYATDPFDFKVKVHAFLSNFGGFSAATISDLSTIKISTGYLAFLTFSSTDTVNFLCSNAGKIFHEAKLRVSRDLTPEQRLDMKSAIASATSGSANSRVRIHWAKPAAFVDGKCVWPPSAIKRQNLSYASVAKNKSIDSLYSGSNFSNYWRLPASFPVISQDAPDLLGSKFFGFIYSWDGKEDIKELVQRCVGSVPCAIDPKRDNIIHAAAAIGDGKSIINVDDGGERNSATQILSILESSKLINAVVIVIRKYGGIHLHGRRYRIFNTIASQ